MTRGPEVANSELLLALRAERRARTLIQAVALAAARARSEAEVLQSALDAVCAEAGWSVGHALRVAADGRLETAGVWSMGDQPRYERFVALTRGFRFAPGEGLPGRALATGRPAWIADVAMDGNFPRSRPWLADDVVAGFAFPVRATRGGRGGIVAVFEFFADRAQRPDDPLLEVMETIGLLVGEALDRLDAEAALANSELEFRSVARSANEAIVTTDAHGRISFWNPSAERMFGWTEEQVLGHGIERIVPERFREAHLHGMARMRTTGESRVVGRTVALFGVRHDGTEFPLELSLGTWEVGGTRYFSAVVRDTSEREAARHRLEVAAAELSRQHDALERSHAELLRSYQQAERIFAAYAEILPGTELDGRYRLEERIGSGGYGVVYRARQLALDRPVAVKLFRPASGRITPDHVRRFRLEGISTCRVVHPNAVSVLDSGVTSDGLPYLAMELLEGVTLGDRMRADPPLTVGRCAEVLAQVCEALAAAHESGIVHRDVKPDNVFLHRGPDGEIAKILDFGIAKLMDDEAGSRLERTRTGHAVGTPTYMSPERLDGGDVDGRADVYSVGVILYELLTGRPPYDRGGTWDMLRRHAVLAPRPLREIDDRLPLALEELASRVLAPRASDRPTATEAAAELRSLAVDLADLPARVGTRDAPAEATLEQ